MQNEFFLHNDFYLQNEFFSKEIQKSKKNYMRENVAFVKDIHAFFLKCNYFSNSFATFKQPQIIGRLPQCPLLIWSMIV